MNFNLNQEQQLLLQAALLQGEAAINSWQKWRTLVNIDDVDQDSYRLLPLLYRNLSAHNVTDSYIGRLKGVYRRAWVENQVWFQKIRSILGSFQEADIKIMLLKDPALNLHYYQDYGLRYIDHLDFLINSKDVLTAIKLLQELGWIAKEKISNPTVPFSHYIGFENESKQYLSLRWHLFADGFNENAETEFWQNAILTQVNDFPVYILSATDQLFYTCVFGGLTNLISPISRLTDAAIIIQSYPSEIDQDQLLILAQKYRFILQLKSRIMQLQEILNLPISSSILPELKKLSISQFEHQEYQMITGKTNTALNRLKMRYFQYSRIVNTDNFNLLNFFSYLQYLWGLENLWQVPIQVIIRGIKL
ncbi:hypothetical protein PL8927_620042 [Planktothrix serta PCC 8927]|uniref:Nucleotidyltransferase family protein n=1 Tax=Planktothrix serta PCC 8927 TaxID=671068 RepID=A0A7Z9E224_9CYAN|nr:nucleotidyltransferase family protein [Planktothrix serta]VXD19190.1 hypothetical protein PL8927_620042 [Planktothrix serta PCC 8927]